MQGQSVFWSAMTPAESSRATTLVVSLAVIRLFRVLACALALHL